MAQKATRWCREGEKKRKEERKREKRVQLLPTLVALWPQPVLPTSPYPSSRWRRLLFPAKLKFIKQSESSLSCPAQRRG